MAKKIIKKAQEGTELRKGQYKRIGRIAERNPERAERVSERMNKRASRVDRGKEIANPPKFGLNPMAQAAMESRKASLDQAKMTQDRSEFKRQRALDMAESAMEAKSVPKKKMGGMIKRADGSMSKRGLWDNIRANKGSGKKPTAAMLKQEKKIKANTKKK